jgi:hypothetical protein
MHRNAFTSFKAMDKASGGSERDETQTYEALDKLTKAAC